MQHVLRAGKAGRRFRFGSSVAQWPQRQMRAGARLLLHYCNGKATWQLNPGGEVAPKTALNVIKRIDICAVGDCLFEGVASQTYRFIEN